jgi:D-tyrosyl-tRNA(Tyr) deacylase
VVQRVTRARVASEGEELGEIGAGLVVLVGVVRGDTLEVSRRLAARIAQFRIFADERGRMNRSLHEGALAALVVSQFTLAVDDRSPGQRGRRPSFDAAAPPTETEPLYEGFVAALRELGVPTRTGRFGAHMELELVNDGPVTFVLEERSPPPS